MAGHSVQTTTHDRRVDLSRVRRHAVHNDRRPALGHCLYQSQRNTARPTTTSLLTKAVEENSDLHTLPAHCRSDRTRQPVERKDENGK